MARFPDKPLRPLVSQQHLKGLAPAPLPFVIKKAKGVYLYDMDGYKYLDFFLQEGEIVFGHAPPALTKYAKNTLTAGLGTAGGHGRFASKAHRLWQDVLGMPVSLFNSPLEALCALIKKRNIKSLGCSNAWLRSLTEPLQGLLEIGEKGEYVLYEPAWESAPQGLAIAVHSRFYYRTPIKAGQINLLHASPFGGKACTVLFGEGLPASALLGFEEAALLAEGAKFKPLPFPEFFHPIAEPFSGWARLKKTVDPFQALEKGVCLKGELLFFSPLHTGQDLKRLKKTLDLFL